MAKSNLPSVDSDYRQPQRQAMPTVAKYEEPKSVCEGYASRKVDAKLTHSQAITLRDIQRDLQDSGAKLKDGSFVSNRTKAIQWLIENHKP